MTLNYAVELLSKYSNYINFSGSCLVTDLKANRPRINYKIDGRWTTGQMSRFIALVHNLINEEEFDDPEIYICHTCHNTKCINIKHFYVGDRSSNTLDSVECGTHNMSSKTHCSRGHEFNFINTRYRPTGGRACRTCAMLDMRERRNSN